MAFEFRKLHVLAYVNKFTLWHFRGSDDRLDSICAENYFGEAAGMFQEGDMIVLTGADGGRIILVCRTEPQTSLVVTSPLS